MSGIVRSTFSDAIMNILVHEDDFFVRLRFVTKPVLEWGTAGGCR
jgi:hypothetical protein